MDAVALTNEQFNALVALLRAPSGPTPPPQGLIGGGREYEMNLKMLIERQMNDLFAKAPTSNPWEQKLSLAADNLIALSNRVNNQGADFDKAINTLALLSGQIGVAQGQVGVPITQAPVGPIRTAAGDATVQMPPGAAYPPNRQSDQMGSIASGAVDTAAAATSVAAAGIATANVAVSSALASFVAAVNAAAANLANAITPVMVTAAGGASTPSQTQPKPTASTVA